MHRILITGASGGIGQAIAEKLAASGDSLYLHYNQSELKTRALAERLSKLYPGQDFLCVSADLSQSDGARRLLEQLTFSLDGLVYNCGRSDKGLIQDVTTEMLRGQIRLALENPFQIVQKLIQPMIRERYGRIVFISSIWGLAGAANEVLYSMVKGGQNSFVKALAQEVASSGITVNAVAPGAVDTPMMSGYSPEDLQLIREEIPLGRLARPEEVAALVQFLLGPDSAYISGQVLSVNGAWYC